MKLNLHTPFAKTGYGIAGLNIAKALHTLGVDLSVTLIGQPFYNNEEEQRFIQKVSGRLFHPEAPSLKIWHQFAMGERIGKGLHIGMPIFELNRFAPHEVYHLQFTDRLYVSSQWAKEIILDQTNKQDHEVVVVPLGVDPSVFYPQPKTEEGPYTFFTAGKWEIRKGHDLLVEAFNSAFSESDDVCLQMLTFNPFYTEQENKEWASLYKSSRLGDKIEFIPFLRTHNDVADVMRQTDCGVFPARAEGWNLELLEMMAIGKPVIATNYSGHTEFCNRYNCHLIEPTGLEDAYDGKWFHGEGQWASLDIDQLVEYMRYCYENRPSNEAGIDTGRLFNWANSATAVITDLIHLTAPIDYVI